MKIAFLIARAGPTNAPLFRKLSKAPGIDLTVLYFSNIGIHKADYDNQFKMKISWGTDVLKGYSYKILKNFIPKRLAGKNERWFNPGVISEITKNKYDALIIFGWSSFTHWIAFFTAFVTRTPIFLYAESPYNQEILKKGIKQKIKQGVLTFLFKRAKGILYMGEQNRKFYLSYSVPESKLFFVPYATNSDLCAEKAKEFSTKKKLLRENKKIPTDSVVILYVAKLIQKKNPLDLLRAYEELNKKREFSQKISLIFVGDGPLRATLELYTKKNNISNVFFAGFQQKEGVYEYFGLSDVFVLPSGVGETWGLVVNEAMHFALPVVVSSVVGCALDLVKNNYNGYSFPAGDIKELAKGIEKIVLDEKLRKEFSIHSQEIIQKYTQDEDVRGILKALAGISKK